LARTYARDFSQFSISVIEAEHQFSWTRSKNEPPSAFLPITYAQLHGGLGSAVWWFNSPTEKGYGVGFKVQETYLSTTRGSNFEELISYHEYHFL
jgi:hypothetical protein